MRELIEELVFVPGLSGYETNVSAFITKKIQPHASVEVDSIGNVMASLGSGSPRILFSAHMDEIGMVVSYIEDNGFLRMRKVGMLDDRLLVGRVFEVLTSKGKVPGVIGIRPPHLMTSLDEFERVRNVPTWDEIFIDVGTSSRRETEELGIRVMDPIVFKKDFITLNKNRYAARGLDDRFGCAILIKCLQEVCKSALDRQVTFAWTVQEEIGALGGQALSTIGKCDIMFAVDSYSSADVPGIPFHYGPSNLGKGPILRMMDHRSISTPRLTQWVLELARKENIPIQFGPTGGYTDGQHFISRGIPMAMICVPVRYMHSPAEMVHARDLEGLFKLILAIIRADKETLPQFKQA